jgi:2-oxoisovalerate dehydrogenase E1 component
MSYKKYKEAYKKAILIREFETLLLRLFAKGKIFGTVHTCVGQEFTPVILSKYLQEPDYWFSNHRGHGHFISYANQVKSLLAEMMGRTTGVSGGIGGSQHLHYKNFYSNGIQGGMTPIAAGTALVNKFKGNKGVSVVFIGDGTLGEGLLYESLNFCGLWDLPVVFVLENNGYAQSTSTKQTIAGNIQKRVEGFGVAYRKSNIWDLDHLDQTFEEVVETARNGHAVFIEVECYRLNSHSKGDDNREDEEVNQKKNEDLLNGFFKAFPDEAAAIQSEVVAHLETLLEEIENDPLFEKQPKEVFIHNTEVKYRVLDEKDASNKRINELIYESLKAILSTHKDSFFIGEDIENVSEFTAKEYGGAFKVSKDLSTLFPGRVRNTPISEAALTGLGNGIAMAKSVGVVEIMFGDFTTLIFDQIFQHASKFAKMYGKTLDLPLIVRTPMGGRRGYGPTHSQSIEKIFLGIPSVNVVALNTFVNPELIFSNIVDKHPKPTLVIENKVDYTKTLADKKIKGFAYELSEEDFPTLRISPDLKRTFADLTVFCYGGMLSEVLAAADELANQDVLVEIICPTLISPFNAHQVVESVKKTQRLFVVEEGSDFASLSAEVISFVQESTPNKIITGKMGNNNIIPCSKPGEAFLLPGKDQIIREILNLV